MLFAFMVVLTCAAAAQQTANVPATGSNTDVSALEQKIRDLEDRLVMLEGQVRQLKAQKTSMPSEDTASPPTPSSTAVTPAQVTMPQEAGRSTASAGDNVRLGGAGGAAAKALNPDISVIGDFIAGAGHNPLNPTPAFQMHESEVGLQAIVDPYARADFFISFGETGVNVEEGFITFTALPSGFVAKAGKMRAAFGKVNTFHNHVMPWVDRPLVSQNLVGGEDGINDAGFSVEHIIPAPGKWFLDFTGQAFRGDSADVYTSSNKNDLSVVGHLRGYRDLTDDSNLDLGVSYSRGHNLFGGDFITNLYGVDATYRWKPLRRSIYKSFVARSEFIWRQQNQPSLLTCQSITCPVDPAAGFQRAFGFYASGDFQFARRWFVGGRVDRSDRAFNSHLNDKGGSVVLTYWPSEFAQIRGQYRFTRYADRINAHEAFIQLQFALGAHGAHPF
ncbi:MAG: hypothetical protein DMG99_03260 [Acidobacteria bacterium]|nr:MAG: hypothetical protein DMG99_03260 [Acidobacteriota bacterium]